ncbi:P-loop containing nucleoside triphosphate hydrolase protein [Penicillium malachiteum]|nr:P-loop containing nucleoside triphosphate hydrolase protein [Penicillium malachiteum]
MEVLILGLPRTGTQSLAEALTLLGYGKVYHMKDEFIRGDHSFWSRAMDVKYAGLGQPVTREDFDEIFGGEYKAMSDYPAAMFPDELIAAYPSAKVILSTRDEDGWVKSMEDTLLHVWNAEKEASQRESETANDSAPVDPRRLARNEMVRKIQAYAWNDHFEAYGRELFREHNEHVCRLMETRNEEFLEYRVAEGWEPLCRLLGKEIPGQAFPRKDDWAEYKASTKKT